MIPITDYEDCYAVKEDGSVVRIETGRVLKPTINKQTGYLYVSLWKNNIGKTHSVHRLVAKAYIPNPENKPEVNHISSNRTDPRKDNLEWATRKENMQHGYEDGFMSQEHRKHFQSLETEMLLQTVLSGETMTALAKGMGVGLSRLTINLRRKARDMGIEIEFDDEMYRQKCIRAKKTNEALKQAVLQFTKESEFIAEHESLHTAAKNMGAKSSGSISNALSNRNGQKYALGYLWKFK